jgi:hypothetical protein
MNNMNVTHTKPMDGVNKAPHATMMIFLTMTTISHAALDGLNVVV